MHMLYERPERLVLARLIMIDSRLQRVKGTSNNSYMASKSLKKPSSALKLWQIDRLFTIICALNLTFLIHLAAHPELIEIP